jgi:hypothetical protein
MTSISTIKNLAAAGAIAATLGFAAVGLGAGLAQADTAAESSTSPDTSTSSDTSTSGSKGSVKPDSSTQQAKFRLLSPAEEAEVDKLLQAEHDKAPSPLANFDQQNSFAQKMSDFQSQIRDAFLNQARAIKSP